MNQRREREYQNKIDRAFREENPVQVKLTQGQIEIYPRITGASEHLREWVERERIRYIRKMAEAGNPEAMYVLAVGRVNGESIINNIHQSLELCKKAALAGCTEAMVYMGLCCVTRFMGYKGSSLEAIDWFSKAKSKGSVEAIRYLAICKYNGIGDGEWSADVRRSHAMHILESAVAKGDEEARKIYKIMDRCLRVRITEDDIWKRGNIVF